jgi:predicted  nucleic acid-binding Zn-ribbon protein
LPQNSTARAALIRVYDASTEEVTNRARKAWARAELRKAQMDDDLRKRLLAIEVLLQEPEDISDALETELYALRDKLQALALS